MQPSRDACRVGLLAAFLSVLPLPASAVDASRGVMLPGLQSTARASVRVVGVRVLLRGDRVDVSITANVARGRLQYLKMHGSRFGWMGEAEPYTDREFPELKASLDGNPLVLNSRFSAFFGPLDISSILRDARLDPFVIAQTPPFVSAVAGHEIAFNKLSALGAIQRSDDDHLAHWYASRDIRIGLGGAGQHLLVLSYKARPAYALVPLKGLGARVPLARYCISANEAKRLRGRFGVGRSFVVRQYAIPVGLNLKPVAMLQVSASASEKHASLHEWVAFCGVDGRAMTSETGNVSAPARTDSRGVVRILTMTDDQE